MKKILLCVVCLVAAQSAMAQKTTVGVKAGVNYSSAFTPNMYDVDPKVGFAGGFFVEMKGRKNFALQAELLYSRQGFKMKTDGYMGEVYGVIKTTNYLDYIDIPIILKYSALHWLSVDVGYQASVLLGNGRFENKGFGLEWKGDKHGMRSVNSSLVLGLTFRITDRIDVSIRYNLGISDLINKEEGSMMRSSVGQLMVGYRF